MRKTSAFSCKFFLSDFLYVAFQNSIKGAFRTTMKTYKIELLQKIDNSFMKLLASEDSSFLNVLIQP